MNKKLTKRTRKGIYIVYIVIHINKTTKLLLKFRIINNKKRKLNFLKLLKTHDNKNRELYITIFGKYIIE
jgi:CTP synthase (UTP-ammonia lyase)